MREREFVLEVGLMQESEKLVEDPAPEDSRDGDDSTVGPGFPVGATVTPQPCCHSEVTDGLGACRPSPV